MPSIRKRVKYQVIGFYRQPLEKLSRGCFNQISMNTHFGQWMNQKGLRQVLKCFFFRPINTIASLNEERIAQSSASLLAEEVSSVD